MDSSYSEDRLASSFCQTSVNQAANKSDKLGDLQDLDSVINISQQIKNVLNESKGTSDINSEHGNNPEAHAFEKIKRLLYEAKSKSKSDKEISTCDNMLKIL